MKPSNDQELVCGINAVKEIISIRPRSVLKLLLQNEKQNSRIESLSSLAKKNHIEIILEEDNFFERNFIEQNHQGVAILCNKRLEENETFLEKLLEKQNLLILILINQHWIIKVNLKNYKIKETYFFVVVILAMDFMRMV